MAATSFHLQRAEDFAVCARLLRTHVTTALIQRTRTIHTNIWKNDEDIHCLHYILVPKPWDCVQKVSDGSSEGVINCWWWEKYDQMLKSKGSTLREDGIEGEESYLATLVARRTSKDGVPSKPH